MPSMSACISNWRPQAFVFENVEGLLQKHVRTIKGMIVVIEDMKNDDQHPRHNVTLQLMNTHTHTHTHRWHTTEPAPSVRAGFAENN